MLEESNTPELPRRCKHLWCSSITCNGWIIRIVYPMCLCVWAKKHCISLLHLYLLNTHKSQALKECDFGVYLVKAVMLFLHDCVNQNTALKILDKVSKRCYFINNVGQ